MKIVTEKWCFECKTMKPASEFYKNKSKADGLHTPCKSCHKLKSKQTREAHPERNAEHCKKYRLGHLAEVRESQRKYKVNNPDKVLQAERAYRARNPERHRRAGRKYRETHPDRRQIDDRNRRARKAGSGGKVRLRDWRALCERYGNKCLCCGRSDVKLTMDHIQPIARGGAHVIENVQPLCQPCNIRKFTKTIDYRPF